LFDERSGSTVPGAILELVFSRRRRPRGRNHRGKFLEGREKDHGGSDHLWLL